MGLLLSDFVTQSNVVLAGVDPRMRYTRLVGCFGFNGPLRQYFSLYRAVSQRWGWGVGWFDGAW